MSPANWEIEGRLWAIHKLIAGIDEAGRGPLAGPVVAAAVVFPKGCDISWLEDSKKLTAARREELFLHIGQQALAYSWATVTTDIIDHLGILQATFEAMRQALKQLSIQPDFVLIDGPLLPPQLSKPAEAVVRGDSKSASIAAASIIAKVTRDRMMLELHKQFPHYGFDQHKGYATEAHLKAIAQHGPCPAHRRSFEPVRQAKLLFE